MRILISILSVLVSLSMFGQGAISRPSKTPDKPNNQTHGYTNKPEGKIKGHGYVNLGLPSGVKWATCNIGAEKPDENGAYFAWSETVSKTEYTDKNCRNYNKDVSALNSAGIITFENVLTDTYDCASAIWGSSWRMPTKEEFDELVNKCSWKWTSSGGKAGYRVTGPNGKSIFLPAAGYMYGSSSFDVGEAGGYWSATCYQGKHNAYYLVFTNGNRKVDWSSRGFGRSIRPVSK